MVLGAGLNHRRAEFQSATQALFSADFRGYADIFLTISSLFYGG